MIFWVEIFPIFDFSNGNSSNFEPTSELQWPKIAKLGGFLTPRIAIRVLHFVKTLNAFYGLCTAKV